MTGVYVHTYSHQHYDVDLHEYEPEHLEAHLRATDQGLEQEQMKETSHTHVESKPWPIKDREGQTTETWKKGEPDDWT